MLQGSAAMFTRTALSLSLLANCLAALEGLHIKSIEVPKYAKVGSPVHARTLYGYCIINSQRKL